MSALTTDDDFRAARTLIQDYLDKYGSYVPHFPEESRAVDILVELGARLHAEGKHAQAEESTAEIRRIQQMYSQRAKDSYETGFRDGELKALGEEKKVEEALNEIAVERSIRDNYAEASSGEKVASEPNEDSADDSGQVPFSDSYPSSSEYREQWQRGLDLQTAEILVKLVNPGELTRIVPTPGEAGAIFDRIFELTGVKYQRNEVA